MRSVIRCVALLWIGVALVPAAAQDLPYINDREIQRGIERAATAMLEDGSAVKNEELLAQLDRKVADIDPPAEATLTDSGDDVYACAADGVIVVAGIYLCGRCDNYHARCASGFIATSDGVAVTNHHVIDNDDNITLVARTPDGNVVPVAEVLASDKADDVALIRLGGEGTYTPLPIARSARVGQRVHTVTHPDGRFYCYSSGELARFFTTHNHGNPAVRRIQITAPFAKGSSGGPILNDAGQVVSIVTTTDSVYYTVEDDIQKNLQMTFYNTVPYESILRLFAAPAD